MKLRKIGRGQIMKGLDFGLYFADKGECEVGNSGGKSRDKHEEMMLRSMDFKAKGTYEAF